MKRPTQNDVAKLAGVSRAAVSYVINGRDIDQGNISEETRRRILDAAQHLGYEPDSAAQSLRSHLSHIVGLVIPDLMNPHYWQITRGVEESLHAQGYEMLMMSTSLSPKGEHAALRSLLRRRVDGLIMVLHFLDQDRRELQTIIRRKSPVVLLGPHTPDLDTITPEDSQGTRALLEALKNLGHRKIGMIFGVADPSVGGGRLSTYRDFMAENFGVQGDPYVAFGGPGIEDGYRATQALLDRHPGLTALVVINDLLAIGAMHAIQERGVRIPEDISVAGFDDIDMSSFMTPTLTTVKTYAEEMGRTAVSLLLQRLREPDGPFQHKFITGTFIPRASIGPAKPGDKGGD